MDTCSHSLMKPRPNTMVTINSNNNGTWMYTGDFLGGPAGGARGKGKNTKGWRGWKYAAYIYIKTA
jgi:hypothetical protein